MTSTIESGINTYAGNFDKLIDVCASFGTLYSPVPLNLQIASLREQSAKIKEAITFVDKVQATSVDAEDARQKVFSILLPLITRVQAMAIILGLPDAIIVHVKEIVRKIRGQRAHKIKIDPSEEPQKKYISVSQVSFNEQIEHLNQLIALLKSQPSYIPSETDLTTLALDQLLLDMQTTNARVVEAEVSLANARQNRNELLYAPKTGMMDSGLAVKEYVKAVFGYTSPQYKQVKHISFRNKKI
jgi:hypothetical protein